MLAWSFPLEKAKACHQTRKILKYLATSYSEEKIAELIKMLIITKIIKKNLIKTCAYYPRFLCGTNEILNHIELAFMIVFT